MVLDLAGGGRRDGGFGVFGQFELVVEGKGGGRLAFHGKVLEFEDGDFLGFAVFEDGEVFGFEAFDGFAGFVFDGDVDDDQVAVGGEGGGGLGEDGEGGKKE